MSDWIKCSERLPEEGALVLTYEPNEQMRIDYVVKLADPEYIWARQYVDDWAKVTHWMPLPKEPEE